MDLEKKKKIKKTLRCIFILKFPRHVCVTVSVHEQLLSKPCFFYLKERIVIIFTLKILVIKINIIF